MIVNTCDTVSAVKFLQHYNIPYSMVSTGEFKGKIRTSEPRRFDFEMLHDVQEKCPFSDHSQVFRDETGKTIVTVSPYNCSDDFTLPGYKCTVSDISLYGMDTKTYVFH